MQNDEGIVVEELNTLLRGTYMGIRTLEHYIQKTDNQQLKQQFQRMQQEEKQNANKLAERIQNLNGAPADSEGFTGAIHSYMHKWTTPKESKEMIEQAIKGMDNYGVAYAEEVVKGDIDPESKRIVEEVINTNRNHADQLKQIQF
ncbi:bacterioferritin [Natronobacillus azotifigens]|uniref:DUF2383 domain-containing protein n=1 Tax=Natronobacillus azotifigens TaxID=472978 RepID=A0A9J6R7M7_9BACI|nr:DUF2383 domain-containing protein [Natronobacillus azotifigens]MCZ0701632.1 DUF2383 domain-containing protein [Natronobacillus azotifigens]